MNKLLFILLGASVALNFFLATNDAVLESDVNDELHGDQISVAQAGVQKEKDMGKFEKTLSKVHDTYENDKQDFFTNILRLGSEDISKYQELRDKRLEEIKKYINGRNKEKVMLSKKGRVQIGKINEEYNTKLRKLL